MSRRRRRRHSPVDETGATTASADASGVEVADESATPPRQRWLSLLLAWFPMVLLALGNGRHPWIPALAALAVGLLLVLNPPRNRLPYSFLFLAALIAGLPLLTLLPLPAASQLEWRQVLVTDYDLDLPDSFSAQPWVTLENSCLLMLVLLWLLWCAGHWQTAGDRMPAMRHLALGLTGLAVVALGFHFSGWQPSTWGFGTERDIGPYANRNHFACLMAMNAILCLAVAYDQLRRKKPGWVLFGLALIPCFTAVIVNTSLGGMLAFGAGVAGWLAMAALRGRSLQRLAVMGAVLLVLTAGVVLFGQHLVRQVFDSQAGILEKVTEGGRPEIYRNTLSLIQQHPLLGVGLGNFAAVFGMTHQMDEGYVRFRHPESDWLWFLAEAGWPATLAALVSLTLFLGSMGLSKSGQGSTERRERRARLTAGLAVLVSLGHGIVDVPNHNLMHALLVALLASMALHPQGLKTSRGTSLQLPFRIGGVALIAASALWFATGLGYPTPMGDSVWQRDLAKAKTLLKQGEVKTAAQVVNQVIDAAPLSWEAYFVRAETSLKLGKPSSAALADFARARAMEPNVAHLCMVEAQLWLRYDPPMAVPAWREALRREQSEETTRYATMLQAIQLHPELRPAVRGLATRARLLLAYLWTTRDEEFQATLQELISQFPQLEGMSSHERYSLFHLWRQKGDRTAMVTALQANTGWLQDGWPVLAQELAAQDRPKEAYELAQKFIVTSMTLSHDPGAKLEQLEREFLFFPSDPQRGFRLYVAQREAKQYDAAIRTLTKMAAQPTTPRHVNFELGKVYALKGDYANAWRFTALYIGG
jgi:O-antigen ligase/tetratricopeptide (TPR) repeat protein